MSYCGVFEVRSLEDALGATCGRTATSKCSDCGTLLCSAHAQRCGYCDVTFCLSCLSFHRSDHPKPAKADRRTERTKKSASRALETPQPLNRVRVCRLGHGKPLRAVLGLSYKIPILRGTRAGCCSPGGAWHSARARVCVYQLFSRCIIRGAMDSKTAADLTRAVADVEYLKLRLTALENVLHFRDPSLFEAYAKEIANLENARPHQMFSISLEGLKNRLESQ